MTRGGSAEGREGQLRRRVPVGGAVGNRERERGERETRKGRSGGRRCFRGADAVMDAR